MFASIRRLTAVLELVARDRWGQARQRGLWSIAIPAVVVAGLAVLLVPFGLVLGSVLAGLRGDPRYGRVLEALIGSIFMTWVVTGVVLGARYTMQIDLAQLVRLPLGFRTAWGIRAVASLWGLWLVVFAPVMFACAWVVSSSWAGLVWRSALVLVFAWTTSELTVALRWRYSWLASRRDSLLVTLAVGWLVVTPLLLVSVRGPGAAGRAVEQLVAAVPSVAAPVWLPHVALARALASTGPAPLIESTLVLGIAFPVILIFSYRTFRRAFLVERPSSAPATRVTTTILPLVTQWFPRLSPARRLQLAMVTVELLSITRISNLRLMLAFGLPYFVVFPLMLPVDEFGAIAAVILMAVVFLFCSSLKSNLLGLDAPTVRQYFIWPVSPAAAVRVRLTVLNIAITALCGEAVAVVAIKGALQSLADVVVVGGAFAALLLATDVTGGLWSVRSPVPVSWGRAFPVANDAGSLVMGGAILAVTLVYVGLLVAIARLHLTSAATAVAVALPVIIAAWPWRRFRRWASPALSSDRDRLLASLSA
jgi:hypothetical protein